MKKRNPEAFEISWRKHRDLDETYATKKQANFWYQIGKRAGQSALQKAWDKKQMKAVETLND